MTLAAAFALLLIASLLSAGLPDLRGKTSDAWVLDVLGLTVQGTLVPLAQVAGIAVALTALWPGAAGSIELPALAAFALCFVGVDYLYYWNHRLMHSDALWAVHKVHHSVTQMDVLGTSRNTLWSSVLIVYLWVNGFMVYLLADPWPYAAAVTATAVGDLWRHSTLQPPAPVARVLGLALILPDDHAWHHSTESPHANYGANLRWWDQLHGTWQTADGHPAQLGLSTGLPLWRQLLWPFS